jgi:uncharacterized protein (TIGR02145 family)
MIYINKLAVIKKRDMINFRCSILIILILFTNSCKKDKDENLPSQFQVETSEMTDSRDGQKYVIVKIGDQWWMAENLNYYTPTGSWYYNNDSATFSKPYGRLYLWNTAMNGQASSSNNPSGVQGISPLGWHIPSSAEWSQLEAYLSSYGLNGDALKEKGTTHWSPTNSGTDSVKFNAVPAGTVYNNGNSFANIYGYTTFLTSTIDNNTSGVWGRCLDYDKSIIRTAPLGLQNGWSLRCIKDN